MRKWMLCTAMAAASPAIAANELKFGKSPPWVVPQPIPPVAGKAESAPVAVLLTDQQIQFEPGKTTTYAEIAMKLQKPEGLAAGNISIPWDPSTDTVTVNKLEIHRGNQVIDVLASRQTFTTMRRESNLELAMLDGVLTANIQPEGLREGDIVVLAMTTEHADPVLKGHVETSFAPWTSAQIGLAHARLTWPSALDITIHKTGDLPAPQLGARDGRKTYELTMHDVEPVIAPRGAPVRYRVGRLGEATDFHSWSDAAALMIALYSQAAVIPASGPLRNEVERIRKASADPKIRSELALQLVQQRVRYVALLMGEGGYVPETAETTWSRRFGDCKAKTALLLGILHDLAIEAEPLLVNAPIGDAIGECLPMIGLFNHVLVRAHVGGKTYYLDGTRTGDTEIDKIDVPDFGWALPVVNAAHLVKLVPSPLDRPQSETTIAIDAREGIYVAADITADQIIRGDLAVELNSGLTGITDAQRKEYFANYWKKTIDDLTPGGSSFTFDQVTRELHLSMQGKLKLDWTGGFFHLPLSSIGYTPDLDRTEGPFHDSPFAVEHPAFTRTKTTIHFPPKFFPPNIEKIVPAPVHKTLIGVEYYRVQTAATDSMTVQTSTRSLVPEVSYKDAIAESGELKALADGDVSARLPASYRATAADLTALKGDMAGSAADLVTRGNTLMQGGRYEDAVVTFTHALELEPRNVWALGDRGIAYVWMRKFEQADKDLNAAIALDSDNAVALRGRALKAEFNGDCSLAVEGWTKSLQSDPDNNFAVGHRAICENVLGQYADALTDSGQALKVDPSWMDLRVLRANIYYKRGQNDEVAKEAVLLTAENPRSSYAQVAAGRIYAKLKRTAEAKKAFDAALAIKPEAFVYINRAQSRPFTDRRGRLADLDAALRLEPENSDALAEKAEQLAADGDLKGARQIYDHVVKVLPDEDYYGLRRAVILFKTGEEAEARKIFAGLHATAKSANDLNGLCWTKATAGIMLDSALDECREALKREPGTGAYLDSLALVELRLGNLDTAIADYTQAIGKNAGSSSYLGRALAYARKGDRAHADADLSQALRLDPDAQTRFAQYGLTLDQPASPTHHAAAN